MNLRNACVKKSRSSLRTLVFQQLYEYDSFLKYFCVKNFCNRVVVVLIIPVLRRQRQEDFCEFKTSLHWETLSQDKKKKKKNSCNFGAPTQALYFLECFKYLIMSVWIISSPVSFQDHLWHLCDPIHYSCPSPCTCLSTCINYALFYHFTFYLSYFPFFGNYSN